MADGQLDQILFGSSKELEKENGNVNVSGKFDGMRKRNALTYIPILALQRSIGKLAIDGGAAITGLDEAICKFRACIEHDDLGDIAFGALCNTFGFYEPLSA